MALAAEGADCGDIGDTVETADFAETGETADFAETGETADFAETGETADFADTGETADFADTGETADFADTAETADCAESATAAEASAFSATRSTEENPCCAALSCTTTVSLTGTIGWATATPAPMATTPSAPVMDQNVRDFFMAANLSFIVLLLICFKHGQ